MLSKRVKYIIRHLGKGTEVQIPDGWMTSKKSWLRDPVYHGIAYKLSTSLTYHGDAQIMLERLNQAYGVNADVYLEVWVKNGFTDIYEIDFLGRFDFSTIKLGGVGVSLKFNSSLTEIRFKKGSKAKVAYGVRERLDGTLSKHFPDFVTTTIPGITNTLKSFLEMTRHTPNLYKMKFDGGDRSLSFPLNLTTGLGGCDKNPHEDIGLVNDRASATTMPDIEGKKMCFWSESLTDVKLTVTLVASIKIGIRTYYNFSHGRYSFLCDIFDRDGIKIRTERVFKTQHIRDGDAGHGSGTTINFNMSETFTIDVKKYESVSIRHVFFGYFKKNAAWKKAKMNIDTANRSSTATITVVTNETLENFANKTASVKSVLEGISDVGMNANFVSNYLDEGLFKNLMISNGFMFRGLFNETAGYKGITTSFYDLFKSLNTLNPIGVEISDGLVRLEEKDYFYQDFIYKDLGEVIDLSLVVDKKKLLSLVSIGFEKFQKIENGSDLLEFNANSEFATTLDSSFKEVKILSKVRGDSTGIDTARRGYFDESDEDLADECKDDKTKSMKGDNDLWFIDVVEDGENFRAAVWSDHFSKEPSGLPNAGSYFNFRLTPRNMLERHLKSIKEGYNNIRSLKMTNTECKGLPFLTTYPNGVINLTENAVVSLNGYNADSLGLIATFETRHKFNDMDSFEHGTRNFYGLLSFYDKSKRYAGHIIRIDEKDGKARVTCLIKTISKR